MNCAIGRITLEQPSLHGRGLFQNYQNQNSLIRFSLTLWFLRGAQDPIPSRTRPSNSSAPMVLSLKTWESRSLQGLPKTDDLSTMSKHTNPTPQGVGFLRFQGCTGEGARQHLGRPQTAGQISPPPVTKISGRRGRAQNPASQSPAASE